MPAHVSLNRSLNRSRMMITCSREAQPGLQKCFDIPGGEPIGERHRRGWPQSPDLYGNIKIELGGTSQLPRNASKAEMRSPC